MLYLPAGSVCGLGPDLVGVHSISLAARYRTAACSNTLNQGLEKIQAARAFDFAPILWLCPNWEKDFLSPSMSRSTLDAFNVVCRLKRDGKLDEASQDQKQKVATGLLCDQIAYTGFCSRVPGNMPHKTHACSPVSELPLAEAQSQTSASSQCSYHNT